VPITDGHGGPLLGRLQHAEVGAGGGAHIVGEVYAPLPAGDQHGRLYFSAEGAVRGGDLELRAVAITASPAMMLAPVRVLSEMTVGDMPQARQLALRTRDPHSALLLQRAQDAVRRRRHGAPVAVGRPHKPDPVMQADPATGAV
jgi:hypothetical protein